MNLSISLTISLFQFVQAATMQFIIQSSNQLVDNRQSQFIILSSQQQQRFILIFWALIRRQQEMICALIGSQLRISQMLTRMKHKCRTDCTWQKQCIWNICRWMFKVECRSSFRVKQVTQSHVAQRRLIYSSNCSYWAHFQTIV